MSLEREHEQTPEVDVWVPSPLLLPSDSQSWMWTCFKVHVTDSGRQRFHPHTFSFIRGPEKARGVCVGRRGGDGALRGRSTLLFICIRINICPARGALQGRREKNWDIGSHPVGSDGWVWGAAPAPPLQPQSALSALCTADGGGPTGLSLSHLQPRLFPNGVHAPSHSSFLPFCVEQRMEFQGSYFSIGYSS